jgi:hypothetical protein
MFELEIFFVYSFSSFIIKLKTPSKEYCRKINYHVLLAYYLQTFLIVAKLVFQFQLLPQS